MASFRARVAAAGVASARALPGSGGWQRLIVAGRGGGRARVGERLARLVRSRLVDGRVCRSRAAADRARPAALDQRPADGGLLLRRRARSEARVDLRLAPRPALSRRPGRRGIRHDGRRRPHLSGGQPDRRRRPTWLGDPDRDRHRLRSRSARARGTARAERAARVHVDAGGRRRSRHDRRDRGLLLPGPLAGLAGRRGRGRPGCRGRAADRHPRTGALRLPGEPALVGRVQVGGARDDRRGRARLPDPGRRVPLPAEDQCVPRRASERDLRFRSRG